MMRRKNLNKDLVIIRLMMKNKKLKQKIQKIKDLLEKHFQANELFWKDKVVYRKSDIYKIKDRLTDLIREYEEQYQDIDPIDGRYDF